MCIEGSRFLEILRFVELNEAEDMMKVEEGWLAQSKVKSDRSLKKAKVK